MIWSGLLLFSITVAGAILLISNMGPGRDSEKTADADAKAEADEQPDDG